MSFENWDKILGEYEGDPYRRFVMIPALIKLLPNLQGKSLLDVGCGNGILIPHLLEAGAESVVGIDIIPELLEIARKRLPETVKLYQKDVTKPFQLAEAPFDGAVSNFVLNEVENLKGSLQNIYDQLHLGAFFIMGVTHPTFLLGKHIIHGEKTLHDYKSYFAGQRITDKYFDKGQSIDFETYTFPVSAYVNTAIEVGFQIEKMIEPETTSQVIEANPEYYLPYKQLPVSMYLLLRKVG